jgi:hypothetical protein
MHRAIPRFFEPPLAMNLLSRFVGWIFDASRSTTTSEAEDYLSHAVDLNDLERRMRELDARRAIGPFGLNA